ncbi:MAG: ribosome small subunit-dependent GTPase A [Lachnospiraceae bacterium]|nr:ribosome small subunit-dependent GTPase A [Lachnospiraceae bacterium]
MRGKIIKGIGGFYYVSCTDKVYTCKARGVFRSEGKKPLVGDDVEIEVIDETAGEGSIVELLERRNELIRPAAANVDGALVMFAVASPSPNFGILDRFLVMMKRQDIETVICFNKSDIVPNSEILRLGEIYKKCGHKVLFTSVLEDDGVDEIRKLIKGKTTILAGPSGVGKSSLTNLLAPGACMETGELSRKVMRGKQTTRHTELIRIDDDTFICDTPGFTSLYVDDMPARDLKVYFAEFEEYECNCRFQSCMHINEPSCAVREAAQSGLISMERYENYVRMYDELSHKKNYTGKVR